MMRCKVCVAAAVLAAVGGLSHAVRAADEIQIQHEVWAFDPIDGWSLVAPPTSSSASAGLDVEIVVPALDPTPGRFNVLRLADLSTAIDPQTQVAGAAVHGIGHVTLRTSSPSQIAGTGLFVLVGATTAPFGQATLATLSEGVVNFGGLTVVGPPDAFGNPTEDDASRDAVKLFATISGDLTGNISVGEIQRFVATGVTQPDGSLVGGNIGQSAVLEATKEVPIFYAAGGTSDSPSINYVLLGGGLYGKIRATKAGIFEIRVGSVDHPGVINGTIEAPLGSIGIVECAGDIGQGVTAQITAGDSIRQIRVNRLNAGGTVVPTDIFANISAGTLYMPGPEDDPGVARVPASISGDVELLNKIGTIGLIESTKDISGNIRALNLGRGIGGTAAAGFSRDGRLGIIARGEIAAEVRIDWNVDDADIIGSDVGYVFIGNQLNGSVVAYGDTTVHDKHDQRGGGKIAGLGIGYGANPPITIPVPSLLAMPSALAATYPPGFVGSVHAPMNRDLFSYVPPTAAGPQPAAERFPQEIWFPQPVIGDTGSRDSVVYAEEMQDGCYIAAMSLRHRADLRHPYRPRIEVKTFAKDLKIGAMSAGVVWSGRLPFAWAEGTNLAPAFEPTAPHRQLLETRGREYIYDSGEQDNQFRSRYSSNVRDVDIGCMGPAADVYCFGKWAKFDVSDDMLGEIHVPEMLEGRALRIFGRLGASITGDIDCGDPGDSPTGPWPDNSRWGDFDGDEPSPRGHDLRRVFTRNSSTGELSFSRAQEPSIAPYGSVRLGSDRGLNASIIVHAAALPPLPGEPWSQNLNYLNGLVWLGDRPDLPATPRVMGRTVFSDDSLILPRYTELGRNLSLRTAGAGVGGGSVALAPFALHGADCSPPRTADNLGLPFSRDLFVNGRTNLQNPNQRVPVPIYITFYGPLTVWGTPLQVCFESPDGWVDVTDQFEFNVVESGRRIELRAAPPPSQSLTLVDGLYRVSVRDQVFCASVFSYELPVEGSAPVALGDCGTPIYKFRLTSCMLGGLPNPADVTHDGTVDGSDYIAFINSFAIGDASVDATADITGYVITDTPDPNDPNPPVTPPYPFDSGEFHAPDGTIDGSDFIAPRCVGPVLLWYSYPPLKGYRRVN